MMIKITSHMNYLNKEIETLLTDRLMTKTSTYIKRETYGPFACAEWAIPTLVTMYFIQPFISSLVSEFGKDAYDEIKKTLSNFSMVARKKSRIEPTLTYFGPSRKFSFELSFCAQINEERKIKLMFPIDFSETDYLDATGCFIDFLKDYELGLVTLESIGVELDNQFLGRTIGVVYVPELRSLRWCNPIPEHVLKRIHQEIEQQRHIKKN